MPYLSWSEFKLNRITYRQIPPAPVYIFVQGGEIGEGSEVILAQHHNISDDPSKWLERDVANLLNDRWRVLFC